ncbi:MAG TPA: HYR domain-containing protein, partial [Saprospiraceae bacterium]|nr:HYR domain-containing protein [Saprospiraceae bacterium]
MQRLLPAQVLINPSAEGGFNNGATFSSNGWNVSNGSATNKWELGTAVSGGGISGRSAYISNNGGTSHFYDTAAISTVHFYRDITFPVGVPDFTLSFDLKVDGRKDWDELLVSLAPTNFTPSNNAMGTSDQLGSNVKLLKDFSKMPAASHQVITITTADIGNCTVPAKWRLIFTWKNGKSPLGVNPPAAIDNISLVGNPFVLNMPNDICENGGLVFYEATRAGVRADGGVFTSSPANLMVNYTEFPLIGSFYNIFGLPFPQFRGQGTFRGDIAPPDVYTILFTYTTSNCVFEVSDELEVIGVPSADLQDRIIDCVEPGEIINLETMFADDSDNTPGGTWTVIGVNNLIDGKLLPVPSASTCYSVTYTTDNDCGPPVSSTAKLMVELRAKPSFELNGTPSDFFGCINSPNNILFAIDRTSTGNDPVWEVKKGDMVLGNTLNDAGGMVSLEPPALNKTVCYTICLTEFGDSDDCSPGILPADYAPCEDVKCLNIIMYNDGQCDNGTAGSTIFSSECDPDLSNPEFEVCETDPNAFLQLSCYLIKVKIPFKILTADLSSDQCAIFCDSTAFTVRYRAQNVFNSIPGFNTKLKDMSPVLRSLCKILNFCICVPGVVRWRPLAPLANWCDVSLATLVSDALEELAGSEGSGGLVVADTDGDGQFDFIVADYDQVPQPTSGTGTLDGLVPNHMSKKGGVITVRHVTGWPFKATNTCGDPTSESLNLLDVISPYIDLIPIAGPIINGVLGAAQCDIPLAFTDAQDVIVPVINSSVPVFKNCPPSGYVFSESSGCTTAANWSIPVAEDGCLGELLTYVGRTSAVDTSNFNGLAPEVFVVKDAGSGVYQTGGPLPGSILPIDSIFTVTYSAFSCRGVQTDCSFLVKVVAGSVQLTCPNDVTAYTDLDQCSAIVTGLAPTSGAGCGTVINYSIVYPAGSGFNNISSNTSYSGNNIGTINDVSGFEFPVGITRVTYTLSVDLNGDGLITDSLEQQSCTFTVTVLDGQNPTVHCADIEVKLDNTGNAVIYGANPNNGNPFIDAGSTDNCDANPLIEIQKAGDPYSNSVSYNCTDVGDNFVNMRVIDDAGNSATCIGHIRIVDYLDGIQINLNPPQLCLEANNPSQLDFSNYLTITLPNGQHVQHEDVSTNAYLSGSQGYFFITAFLPDSASTDDPGSISYDGVFTPGTGTGFITLSYLLLPPGFVPPTDSNPPFKGCYEIAHAIFELRQPLEMASPECACVQENERIVDLGVVKGGLEPYRIQYSGTRLDVNGDGLADDYDGTYTYDVLHGHDIADFQQDLGELRVVYTSPIWSFTVVDARGCEIFRSGSCDNADLLIGPSITCPLSNNTLTTEELVCESQYSWTHPLPTDNCAVVLYEFRITNPDGTFAGPFTLNSLLNTAPGTPLPTYFSGTYDFELGVSTIQYYAEDAQGNYTTCSFQVTVSDNDAPRFLNCPAPPVVQNAESMHCDAYVDFALPLAADNCTAVTITKIDQTGLNTGSRFPVGTTIMYWEARDLFNNKDTCQIKVIVNDYWQDPILSCPANVVKNNDPWLCGATVNNIAPTVDGPCKNNYGVTYTIYADAALTQVKDCGVSNASGEFFDVGDSWVKYTVQNQPLLLITEVSQSGAVDRLEISNLGPADIDISCLEIKRLSSNVAANQTIGPITLLPSLAGTILPVGGTRVYNFAFNGAANLPACYTISYMGTIFDEVSTNGFAGCNGFSGTLSGGDVIRKCEDDTNTAADWTLAQPCYPLTLGAINQDLEVMADNGTQTSLQSILPNKVSCTFKVTVKDAENPFCGKLTSNTTYNGAGIPNINAATCNRSTITIPPGNCIIGDIVFNRTGTATPQNSTMTLISPKGIKVVITELPDDSLSTLFAQKAEGTWTLDIVPLPGQTPTITGWSLTVNCIAPFDVPNQVLPNQAGQCGAPFTWTHPWFVDNCFNGTIKVAYTSTNAACVPTSGTLLGKGGYINTQFFCVGTTQVTYTLTDAAGNTSTCGFSVTVNDVEKPALTCPPTKYVNLNGGECGAFVNYNPAFAADNCAVVDTTMTPPSGFWFDIGNHLVTIVVTDAAGNTRSCTFAVNVIEYVPTDFNLICNDLSHVSMDATCVFVLNADEALEGDNYHCYDDYIITVKNQANQPVGNIFGSADIGKTFTITVKDPETGNSCWSLLKIEDKLVPALTCPADVTIACSESTSVAHTGNVNIQDCSATTSVIDDEYTDFGQCSDPRGQLVRTWIVTDAWGNQAACVQTITITKFDLDDVVFPADITVDCEDTYLNPDGIASVNTGEPSINGASIIGSTWCGAQVGFNDTYFYGCGGTFTILREWGVLNNCEPLGPGNPVTYTQRILVNDLGGPTFVCPPAVTVSTNPFECCSNTALPSMIVSEGCSGILGLEAKVTGTNPTNGNIITFTVGGGLTDFPGNNYWNPDTLAVFNYTQCLPLGTYNVRYKASDECGNTSYCNFELTIADLIPPTVSCDQVTQVALSADGVAVIPAANLNDGTTDNCCVDFFEVRRMDGGDCTGTDFAPEVKFCCSDIGDTIMVVFRAWDCHGNSNDCMVSVLVEDKIKPACQPPANVSVNCENFDPSLWSYGIPDVLDNCCLDTNKVFLGQIGLTHSVNYTLFDTVCNKGTITRTFRAFDCSGNSSQCTQRVFVTYLQDYYVKFPNDAIVTTCDGTGNFGEPLFFGEDCELLGVSHTDEIFTVVPDACFKIERTWQI